MAKAPKLTLPSANLDLTLEAGKMKAITSSATGKNTEYVVPVDQLRLIPGFNVRVTETDDYRGDLESLKLSIREHGFYPNKPLAGYIGKDGEDDVIYLTDGHRRLEAINEINAEAVDDADFTVDAVPVVLKPAESSDADLTIALVQDNSGRPLTPYEMGVVVQRLQGMKDGEGQPLFSKADIARKLSITERYVDDLNVLTAAPAKVRNAVLSGEVSSTLAIQELRKNPKKAEERITTAVSKAKASGKARATKKDIATVKMVKVPIRVSLATGDSIKDVLKSLATQIRAAVAHGEDDVLATDGTISAVIEVPAPAKAEPEATSETPPAKKTPAKKSGTKKAGAAKKTPAPAKAEEPAAEEAAQEPAGEEDQGEPVKMPPAVPTTDSNDDPDDI
jgi:ParB family transcriptional regulator, chromosome partitioning protein